LLYEISDDFETPGNSQKKKTILIPTQMIF
jgi:hypothetical protein